MKELWKAIEDVYAKKYKLKLGLRPGAKEGEIAAAEKAMGITFPPDFRASLAVHDGQGKNPSTEWAPGCNHLVPLKSMVAQWKEEAELAKEYNTDPKIANRHQCGHRVMNYVYHSKRIPIAGTEYWDGDKAYLDLVPAPQGASGQVIALTTECDFDVVGSSFGGFLESLLAVLQSDALVRSEDEDALEPNGGDGFDDHPATWLSEHLAKAAKKAPAKKAPTKKAPAKKAPAKKKR